MSKNDNGIAQININWLATLYSNLGGIPYIQKFCKIFDLAFLCKKIFSNNMDIYEDGTIFFFMTI